MLVLKKVSLPIEIIVFDIFTEVMAVRSRNEKLDVDITLYLCLLNVTYDGNSMCVFGGIFLFRALPKTSLLIPSEHVRPSSMT